MSEILFVTWDGGGNVPPAVAIARELRTRGHTVRFLGHARQEAALTSAGFEFVPGRHARKFSALDANSPLTMLATFGDAGMGRDLLDAVAARPVDLVVIDCLMFGALHAAQQAGLRYAVLEHLYDAYFNRGCLSGPLGLSLWLRGLQPRKALEQAALRVLTSLPELDPVAAPPPNLRQVGPVVEFSPRVTAERPTVLVSLSTFGFPRMARSLQAIVDATSGLDARVIVTTGPAVDPTTIRAHAGVEVHRYVPHVKLMPGVSLLVGHGGHGTTMQALAHDLPVLVMPMEKLSDQPWVGRSLVAAGAGRMIGKTGSALEIAPLVAELLSDGPHRAAAARLGAAVRAKPGAVLGADALEEVLRNGGSTRSTTSSADGTSRASAGPAAASIR
ncbi:MAG: glycosyltransferase [Myxococcota bacterium]